MAVLCLARVSVYPALGQEANPVTHRTPAYIEFSNLEYQAVADSSNAVITVFRTGEFRELATVDYETRDGTAKAGEDYRPTAGTLLIPAGVGFVTFVIPILPGAMESTDRTVHLRLFNPGFNTMITRGEATLAISAPPAAVPTLEVRIGRQSQADGQRQILLSWPASEGCVLERSDDPAGTSWSTIQATPEVRGERCVVVEPIGSGQSFYRLRLSGQQSGRVGECDPEGP
ncbi:MAG: Calx-beta domain-containing protein [Verrucomicrobiia bacterium]